MVVRFEEMNSYVNYILYIIRVRNCINICSLFKKKSGDIQRIVICSIMKRSAAILIHIQ